MSLYNQIIDAYPELEVTSDKDEFQNGSIMLKDDGDGIAYIAKWDYEQPILAQSIKIVQYHLSKWLNGSIFYLHIKGD
jgi:hypothetical protein